MCGRKKEDVQTSNALQYACMTILAPLLIQNPYPGGHEFYNFGVGLPGLHYYEFSFSHRCVEVENIFEELSNGVRVIKFTIDVPKKPLCCI